MQRGKAHHDLLIVRCPALQLGDVGLYLANIGFNQLHQTQGFLLVLHALAQLAAQQDGRSAPENVITQHQGVMINPAIVIDLYRIEETTELQLQLHQRPGDIIGVFLHRSGRILDLHQAIEGAPGKRQDGYIQNDEQWPRPGLSFHPMLPCCFYQC